MGLQDDLSQELQDRKVCRELDARESVQFHEEQVRLVADSTARLVEATEVLMAAGVPMVEARLAHKQRQSWQWPQGRARVHGWIFDCGDQPVMLRSDGWLAAVHRCSDPKQTLCACTFARAAGPLPHQALGVEREESEDAEEAQSWLTIRTTLQGSQADLPFNAWLTQQIADRLEVDAST